MHARPRRLAALAALLCPLLAAPDGASPPGIRLSVTPELIRLAEGGRARVRVFAGEGEEPPRVTASAGRVESPREISPGVYEAEYVPPDSLDPQFAVITAGTRAGFGWTRITLAGVRDVVVSAPHRTLVSVAVAGETFGPAPATVLGRAVVRVAVPPGVQYGTYGKQRVDLGVEQKPVAYVVLDRTTLDANAGGTVIVRVIAVDERGAPIRAIAVDERGMPRRGTRVNLVTSEGAVTAASEIKPGVFEARWTLAPGEVRDAVVFAEVTGRRRAGAVATLERIPGPPASVTVDVDRTTLIAGEGDEVNVTGRVLDAAGNPTAAPAKLVVSLGAGDAARPLPDAVIEWQGSRGVYTGRVQVPRSRSGRQELELKMLAAGSALVGTRTVAMLPGWPSHVKVEPEGDLLADGRARDIRVTVLDLHGNRVELPASPIVTATRGTIGSPERHGAGVYLLEYRSPLSTRDFQDVIRVRAGEIEGQTELRVRARAGALVLGPKVGFVFAKGFQSPQAGAELGLWRRSLDASLGVLMEARFFTFDRTESLPAGSGTAQVKSSATFTAIEASVGWRRPLLRGMTWLAAGAGAVLVSSSVGITGQRDVADQTWVPAAHASVAWGHPLGPTIPFGEVKLAYQGDPGRGPVQGSLESLTFNVGCRFDVL